MLAHPLHRRRSGLALLLLLGAALLSGPGPVVAGNGRVALVFPVDSLTIDGDLADWPGDLEHYPVRLAEYGDRLAGPGDLRAWFVVGYRAAEGALYLGLDVADESSVITGPGQPNYDNRDGCEVFLTFEAADGALLGFQLVRWGDRTGDFFQGSGRAAAGPPPMAGHYQVAATPRPGGHVYEWRIDVRALTGGRVDLESGYDFGLDVVVDDRDADGTFSWVAWGRGASKLGARERQGQALLVARGEGLAEVIDRVSGMSEQGFQRTVAEARERTAYQMFFAGVLLSVTFLHLLLFLYYRQIRTNLYFALFTGVAGCLIYYGFALYQQGGLPAYLGPTGDEQVPALIMAEALLLVCVLGLLFLYSLFYPRLPRRFWVLLVLLIATGVMAYRIAADPANLAGETVIVPLFFGVTLLATAVEMLRVVFRAVRRRQEGAWMMGVGFLAFGAAGVKVATQVAGRGPIDVSVLYAVLVPLASMSVFLARSVARTRRTLVIQNRALEIANQRIREQSAQVQEANRLKSDFLARMSHDLRTPMNAIIGYTRILLRRTKGSLDERQYQNLTNIAISADNLLALINDILDLSRIEAGRTEIRLEEVDLGQLVRQCAASIESLVHPGVELRCDLQEVPPLRTDPDRVRRVLMNLLGNAVKYTEAGHIAVSLRPEAQGVELAVTDTGTGIPAADLPHIFDEFRQVDRKDKKREGSGLGLAIARKSVEILGGTISAVSTEGAGSTFAVRLGPAPV
ncbi:MAG: ATP-binding protein, partial [Gemmatimonadota bacterium]